jgi:hypothetical protein
VQGHSLESSGGNNFECTLRIPRKNLRKASNVVESKSTGAPLPKIPTVTFLSSRVDTFTSIVERLESDLEKKKS